MSGQPIASGFRYSLRGLMLATAFVAIACVSLLYASSLWWTILSAATLLLFMVMTVVAFTGSEEQRTKAIGFSVCFVIYGGLLYLSPKDELNPLQGALPTTKVMKPVVDSVVRQKYIDLTTGKELPDYVHDPSRVIAGIDSNYKPGDLVPFGGPRVGVGTYSFPEPKQLISIAHLLWALLFGFLGSILAGIIYARNEKGRQ